MTDHDDELGAFLRSEVPEPRADYWDGIDAMLRRVEDERTSARATSDPSPGTGDRHLSVVTPVSDESAPDSQTDDDMLRLTDMTHTTAPAPTSIHQRFLPVLAAAAVAVVVGLGTLFALNRDQADTVIDTANDNGSAESSPVGDDNDNSNDNGSDGDNTDGAVVEGLSVGSVWTYTTDELPRPLLSLGDDAGPFAGQIWIKPLVATGATGTHVDQTWLEFEGLDEPNVWLPLSTIEQVADGLPPLEPAELVTVGTTSAWDIPDFDVEAREVLPAGTTLASTGFRSQSDGATWLLISAEFPFFVPEGDTMPASGTEVDPVVVGRQCYSDGSVTLTIDVAADGSVTGWQVPVGLADNTEGFVGDQLHLAPRGDLLLTLAGLPLDGAGPDAYLVSTSSAAALGNGFAMISTNTWTIGADELAQPSPTDEIRFPAVGCDASAAADLALIESTPSYFPPDFPFEPVTITELATTPGANRVCYRQGEGEPVYVFDFTDDGGLANGLRSGSLETISATRTIDGDTTYNVATLILGDLETGVETVTTIVWEISPERINLPFDGEEVPAIDCGIVSDEVAQVEDFLQAAPYPAYPLGS